MLQRFPLVKEIFVDGTERPIRRPTGQEAQKPSYSGKKKGHRVKHVVVTTKDKRVIVLSDTFAGHIHENTGATEHGVFTPIPEEVLVHLTSGVWAFRKTTRRGDSVFPRKHRKAARYRTTRHREKARRRVLVEHALRGVKRFRALTDVLRNSLKPFADRFMRIACGLWNLHVEMTAYISKNA